MIPFGLSCIKNPELVRKLKVQAVRKDGFRLRKWLSNKKQLLERMGQSEEREHAKEMFQMIKNFQLPRCQYNKQ